MMEVLRLITEETTGSEDRNHTSRGVPGSSWESRRRGD